jgi:FtsZ-binding cell division protein ZapB
VVTVRSVVKDGAAANSARPPLPGDTLVKVDGYDVRGLSLTQLRPWITGEEGSVVTLSFEGANVRYDTSIVRAAGPAPAAGADDMRARIPPYGAAAPRERPDAVPDFDRWRQDPLYNPASDEWRHPPAYDGDEYGAAPGYDDDAYDSPHRAPHPDPHYSGGGWRAANSPGPSRRASRTSWAAEADKILAEAQAKIEDALQRERLLQETLEMLREKNAAKMHMQQDTRSRLEMQRDRLKADLEEERERLRCVPASAPQRAAPQIEPEGRAPCSTASCHHICAPAITNSSALQREHIHSFQCRHGFSPRWEVLRRMESRSRDALDAELRKSEERLFMLTSHLDRHQSDGTLF